MESVGSNHIPPCVSRDHRVADRIIRALRHRIRLLHRPTAATFHVLGATCNVYTVTLATTPTCTCPDRTKPCKHILFVLIRALGVPADDQSLRRRSLRPCHLYRLVSAPTRPDCLAGLPLRERFHQLLSGSADVPSSSGAKMENKTEDETATCPICLDEIKTVNNTNGLGGNCGEERERAMVKCRVCKNKVHEECMVTWKRSRGRRPATCVVCRARWRDYNYVIRPNVGGSYGNYHMNCYLNLSPYVGPDEESGGTSGSSCGG